MVGLIKGFEGYIKWTLLQTYWVILISPILSNVSFWIDSTWHIGKSCPTRLTACVVWYFKIQYSHCDMCTLCLKVFYRNELCTRFARCEIKGYTYHIRSYKPYFVAGLCPFWLSSRLLEVYSCFFKRHHRRSLILSSFYNLLTLDVYH